MDIGFNPAQFNPSMLPGSQVSGMPFPAPQAPNFSDGSRPAEGGFGDQSVARAGALGGGAPTSKLGSAVGGFVGGVDALQDKAAATRTAFLSGESGNLHQTMIASQEASVAFSLMVEMRNKVMEGYQELMRMQI